MAREKTIAADRMIQAALTIISKEGHNSLNARRLASELGCSTKPIYHTFGSMEKLQREAYRQIEQRFRDFSKKLEDRGYVPYKALGMSYILFAKEEPNFFRLLFMRDRSKEGYAPFESDILTLAGQASDLPNQSSQEEFHLSMWIYVHGIACMLVTRYLDLKEEVISQLLTKAFLSFKPKAESPDSDR